MTDTSGINSTIAANITTNGRGAITGAILASVLASGGLTAWVATQYPPHVASLAALQTFTSSYATTVIRDDYAVGNGAPPMTYKWYATCPGTPDNTALYVQPTGTSPACWSAAADPNVGDTREWGAVNDSTPTTCGAHDNQAAIQAAVNALPASIRVYNAGWSCTKSQVNVSKPGQVIACAGGLGGHHDVSTEYTAPAGFIAGASMGVMFQYKSATTSANYGNGMDCSLNGNSLAAIGIDSYSMRNGTWNVSGAHFTTSIIQADIDTGLAEIKGSTENQYRIIADQGLATDGSTFKCVGTATADCSQDNFLQISGVTSGLAPAVDMDNGDSESFFNINLYSNNIGGTKCGVRLRAGASSLQAARNNLFYYLGVTNASCPIYAEGTEAGGGRNTASNQNIVYSLDTANNAALPTIGTGATLSWATIRTPIGTQAYTKNSSVTAVTDSNGVTTQTGTIGPVAANTNGTANLTINLATGCNSVSIQPSAVTTGHVVSCATGSPSVLTIHNDGSNSSYFYYTVIGY